MDTDRQKQDQQQQREEKTKQMHYCRICKKGFGCGRALGGHMRAHGINVDQADDWDDDSPNSVGAEGDNKQNNPSTSSTRMYALRTNAKRLRSNRVCENCGKEFLTWQSFLEHRSCNSDVDLDEVSSPSSQQSDDGDGSQAPASAWYKGKRSQRNKPADSAPLEYVDASTEEENLANCLVMLSEARVDPPFLVAETEESSSSSGKEDDDDRPETVLCIPTTTAPHRPKLPAVTQPASSNTPPFPRGMFECKACKKVFTSHQALGGHRASHKKVKGCFATRVGFDTEETVQVEEDVCPTGSPLTTTLAMVPYVDNPQPVASAPTKKKSKVHECSICHRQFASGQALGGHKRCHLITSNSGSVNPAPITSAKLQRNIPEVGSSSGVHHYDFTIRSEFDSSDTLDLNQPAPVEDLAGVTLSLRTPAAVFINQQQKIKDKVGVTTSGNNVNNSNEEKDQQAWIAPTEEDDGEMKAKMPMLSNFKEMKEEKEGSQWLQLQLGAGGSSAAADDDHGGQRS